MKSYSLKSWGFCLSWDRGIKTKINPWVIWSGSVLRANLKDSDKMRLLKESSGIALSANMEGSVYQCGASPSSLMDSGLPLPSPGKEALFCLSCCLENNVGFGMFVAVLRQIVGIAKGLRFVTLQLNLLLGIWEVKEGATKKPLSGFCVQVVSLFSKGGFLLTFRRESGFFQRPLRDGAAFLQAWVRNFQERWDCRHIPVCSILYELGLTWLSAVCVFFVGDLFSIPSLECPDLSLSVVDKAASEFTPCSTSLKTKHNVT